MQHEFLPGPFGVVVDGLDVNRANDADFTQLAALLFANRILVIRGQSLDNDQYIAFGRRWGTPLLLIAKKSRLASHPEMIIQSNSTAVPPAIRNSAAHWHCDSSYEEVPATVTMLLGILAPEQGGETRFCDLVGAYEALPAEMKSSLAGLNARHCVGGGTPREDEHLIRQDDVSPDIKATLVPLDPVIHPLVRKHPVTGKPALYGLGGTPFEVLGTDNAGIDQIAGAALIEKLKIHATAPRFCQTYRLMPGDLLLWDNFSVMHRATKIEYSDEPRKMRLNYRISVKGLPSFLTS